MTVDRWRGGVEQRRGTTGATFCASSKRYCASSRVSAKSNGSPSTPAALCGAPPAVGQTSREVLDEVVRRRYAYRNHKVSPPAHGRVIVDENRHRWRSLDKGHVGVPPSVLATLGSIEHQDLGKNRGDRAPRDERALVLPSRARWLIDRRGITLDRETLERGVVRVTRVPRRHCFCRGGFSRRVRRRRCQ